MVGVSGVNARFHAEMGNIPENVPVTTLSQNMEAPIALVMQPKQELVPKALVQVCTYYA